MAAPSIGTGISQLNASDANTWTGATIGNANGAISDTAVSQDGINPPNTCSTFENSSSGTTINLKYSAYSGSFSANADISGANQALLFHFAGNPGQFNRVSTDSDGITVYASSDSNVGTTNYLLIELGGSDDGFYAGAPVFNPILFFAADSTERGTVNETAINSFGIAWKARDTGQFGVDFRVDQVLYIDGEVHFEDGDGVTPGTFSEYFDLLKATAATGVVYNSANYQEKPVYGWGFPVRMNCENFADSNFTFYFKPENTNLAFTPPSSGYYSLSINPSSATATHSYTDGVFAFDSGSYDLDIDFASATSGDFTRCSFLNTNDVTIVSSNTTLDACTFPSPNSVDIDSADVNLSVDDCAGPVTVSGQLASGSRIEVTNPQADSLQFDIDPVDDSGRTYVVPASTVNVNPTTTGTYTLTGIESSGSVEFDNLSANNVTINISGTLTATVASPTTGGGTITLVQPQDTLTVTSNVSALIQIFTFGTQTLLASTTGTSLAYVYSGSPSLTIRVQAAEYSPQKQDISPIGSLTSPFTLIKDNVYESGSPLTYGVDIVYDRLTKLLSLNTSATVVEQYSALIDAFISETSLYNTDFDFQMNGSQSLFLIEDAEYDSDTDAENSTRGGIRYVDSSGVSTAEWFGALSTSSIDTSTFQARYQLQIGTGTTNANALGDVDQVIKVYGDATHGNFDFRSTSPRFKMQPNGYYQADADIHAIYGITDTAPILYVFSLSPIEIPNFTTGDPGITGVAFTNYGASPIVRESLNWGSSILDSNNNTGENIQRWWNWNISQGGTFQSFDTFNLPNFIFGAPYQTLRGEVIGSAGTTLRGCWVERPSSTPHPDFFQQESDDGTLYVLPVTANASVSNIEPGSRLRIFNQTTATEIVNQINATSSYSASYTDGTDYSSGDVVLVYLTYQSGTTAKLEDVNVAVATTQGWSVIGTQQDDDVYILNGIDGSTITKFTADYVDDEVDVTVASNFTATEFYAWWVFNLTTSQGIAEFFGGYTALDAANYRNNTATVDIFWDNLTTTNIHQTDASRVYRDDEIYPVKNGGVTTGGGGVDLNWNQPVLLATTGSGPLTPAQEAQLASAASDSATAVTQNADIQGSGFDTNTDSLVQIAGNVDPQATADAFLNRNLATGSDGGRTVQDALRSNRNRVEIDPIANTITVYEEDDTTVAWSGSITQGARDPINSVDPS